MASLLNKLPRIGTGWRFFLLAMFWLLVISQLHYQLNGISSERKLITMGYMPVIANMAAPVLDHVSKEGEGVRFRALKYASFAEMAEALRNGQLDVAFMIAPLSVVLRQQGEDVKIVLIGNRHESTLVAKSEFNAHRLEDLEGKTIAVPMRFSGHNISIINEIEKRGLTGRINVVEMNPPDMASALASGSLDAYYVGEPFAAQTLKSGKSKLVFFAEDVWPGFFSNLVVVRKDWIDKDPEGVMQFVQGAARAGLWASANQEAAAQIASKYWNQPLDLVNYALNTPPNRMVFDGFKPIEREIQEIADELQKQKLLDSNDITGLVDDSFAAKANVSNIQQLDSVLIQP